MIECYACSMATLTWLYTYHLTKQSRSVVPLLRFSRGPLSSAKMYNTTLNKARVSNKYNLISLKHRSFHRNSGNLFSLSKLRDEVEEEPFGAGGLTYYTKAWDSCCTLPMSPHNFNYLNLVLLNLRSYLWPPCKTKVSYLNCQDPKLYECFSHLYNPPT